MRESQCHAHQEITGLYRKIKVIAAASISFVRGKYVVGST